MEKSEPPTHPGADKSWILLTLRSASRSPYARVLTKLHVCVAVAYLQIIATPVFGQPHSLHQDSPLATDGERVFAVASDGETVLVRPVESERASWERFQIRPRIGRIGGLAAREGTLFVSNSEKATLYRVDLTDGRSEIVHKGKPFVRPLDLAIGEMLFVADPGARQVFQVRLGLDTQRIEPVKALPNTITGEGSLAYSMGTLGYAEGDNIWRVTRVEDASGGKLETLQGEGDSDPRKALAQTRTFYKKGHVSTNYPTIAAPRSIAAFNGVAYAVSGQTGLVYATPRLVRKAVNSSFGLRPGEQRNFTRIALTKDWLFAIDAQRGDVVRWRRPVPVEFTIKSPPPSECLSAFYAYLQKNDALPSRTVPLSSSLERTLRDEGILAFPYVSALDSIFCSMNSDQCTKGKPKRTLAPGTTLHVPDVFVEALLAYSRTRLEGKKSLGQLVDDTVRSEEFSYARQEDWLRRLNRVPETDVTPLRDAKIGEFIVPNELVRYVAAVPAKEVTLGAMSAGLEDLRRSCPGITINPLERREAANSGLGECAADWQAIDDSHVQCIKSIHAANLPTMQRVNVAVVESEVETSHPDFASDSGAVPFNKEPVVELKPPPPSARCFDLADHGTAVTAAIGAQRWRGKSGVVAGLAPDADIEIFRADFASLPTAMFNSEVSQFLAVVNISGKSVSRDGGLASVLSTNQNVLFVVAAGNTKGAPPELCSRDETRLYPACYDDSEFPNVLVVGATTLDGTSWLQGDDTTEGSNWSQTRVHVAAPGVGYWLPGKGGAYVPIRGTSFATPLVAAAAARLAAQNIRLPRDIKYRIIATADFVPNLRPWVMGGLLNVERAVTSVRQTLIRKKGEEMRPWSLSPAGQVLKISIDGISKTISAERILRLTHLSNTLYRIVYLDDSGKLKVSLSAELPADRPLKIQLRNEDPDKPAAKGTKMVMSLSDVDDYIGAVPSGKETK